MRKAVFASLVLLATAAAAPAQERWIEKMFTDPETKKINTVHDFGSVPHGAQLYYRFPVTNIYAVPLEITDLRVSCGCVKATTANKVLQPKQTGTIDIHMNTTLFTGPKSVSVHVAVSNPNYNSSTELKVSALIRQDVVFNPGQADFGVVNQGETPSKSVDVDYAGSLAGVWKITDVVTNDLPVEVKFAEKFRQPEGRPDRVSYSVNVTLKKELPVGVLRQAVYLKTNDPAGPLVPLFIEGSVQAMLEVRPSILSLTSAQAGKEVTRAVVLRGAKPFRILQVEGTDGDISLASDLPSAAAKEVQSVTLKIKPASAGELKK